LVVPTECTRDPREHKRSPAAAGAFLERWGGDSFAVQGGCAALRQQSQGQERPAERGPPRGVRGIETVGPNGLEDGGHVSHRNRIDRNIACFPLAAKSRPFSASAMVRPPRAAARCSSGVRRRRNAASAGPARGFQANLRGSAGKRDPPRSRALSRADPRRDARHGGDAGGRGYAGGPRSGRPG